MTKQEEAYMIRDIREIKNNLAKIADSLDKMCKHQEMTSDVKINTGGSDEDDDEWSDSDSEEDRLEYHIKSMSDTCRDLESWCEIIGNMKPAFENLLISTRVTKEYLEELKRKEQAIWDLKN